MDEYLKKFQKLSGTPRNKDYRVYLVFAGVAYVSGKITLPYMKSLYTKWTTNANVEVTHICYLDLNLDGKEYCRLDVGLYMKHAPENVNNFLHLLMGT